MPANHLSNLNKGKLVEKANEAVSKMSTQCKHPLTEIRIVGAKKLQNGSIVYKLNNPESALWLHKEKAEFMKHYGKASVMEDKSVSVIVEYIPVTHNPDTLGESKKIEGEMGLPPESIDSTRRSVGQCTTHFITKLCSPKAANQAIRDRLIIEGKQVWARRMKKEPRRCLKCQSMGSNHLAAECNQTAVCRTCGKEH